MKPNYYANSNSGIWGLGLCLCNRDVVFSVWAYGGRLRVLGNSIDQRLQAFLDDSLGRLLPTALWLRPW